MGTFYINVNNLVTKLHTLDPSQNFCKISGSVRLYLADFDFDLHCAIGAPMQCLALNGLFTKISLNVLGVGNTRCSKVVPIPMQYYYGQLFNCWSMNLSFIVDKKITACISTRVPPSTIFHRC